MTRKVEVVDAKKDWKNQFKHEEKQLESIFTNEMVAIYHIGSTAIEGIKAKPVIDIMMVVLDIEKVDNYNHAMEQLGYNCLGENGMFKRRFFIKGGDQRSHHIHVFQIGNPEIDRHLAFRDFLNNHREDAEAYSRLKSKLAEQFPYDIQAYIDGKDAFIKAIDRKAIVWKKEKNNETA
ncbi:GrpB family protein [Candidatus Enterococcus ikei]|uniref:GrpB family protein n=1 Tax=Candidatus Enterococcus ikei TaxID=2815326 RepID=A0ABS3GU86_9ENTE|nr:GrpB family protein [Enterococcus sp. DIV0869a]MBO0438821.1 GrpB family protein [Enterococcus sp. DIV0869a]